MNRNYQKISEIMLALKEARLDLSYPNIKRVAYLMRYHLVKNRIVLEPDAAVVLFKAELAEYIVKTKGRDFIHVIIPMSFN